MVKKASVKAMKQLAPETVEDEESWQSQLENLIMMELVKPKETKVVSKPLSKVQQMAIKQQEETYEEVEVDQEDDDDLQDNDDY